MFGFFRRQFFQGVQDWIQRRKDLKLLMAAKKSPGPTCPHCGSTVGKVDGIFFCGTCNSRVELPKEN